MSVPIMPDSSDRVIEMSKAARVSGWYVDRSLVPDDPTSQAMPTWIEFIERNPDATLPNGVGGAVLAFLKTQSDLRALDLQGRLLDANTEALTLTGQLAESRRDAKTFFFELKRIEQASGAPDPFAIAEHVLDKMVELDSVKRLAGRWQEAALKLAPVTMGTVAIAFDPMQPEAWVTAVKAHSIPLVAKLAELREALDEVRREVEIDNQLTPEFEAALRWHENGKHVSPTAPSIAHTTAILDHFGYKP